MARVMAAFLLVFWLLGLGVHLSGSIHLFALIAVACIAIDFFGTDSLARRLSRTHPNNLL